MRRSFALVGLVCRTHDGDFVAATCSKARMAGEIAPHGLKDALVILGAAGIVIPAFARLRISPVIGFIIVGMIVGPFGLGGLASQHQWLNSVTITD